MKNVLSFLLAVCFIVFTAQIAWAAATPLATSKVEYQDQFGSLITYHYAPTNVGAASTVVFKIAVPRVAGIIKSWHFKSTSIDCDVFVNGEDSGVLADAFIGYAGFNLGGRPEVAGGLSPYWNADTPQAAYLYVTVKNDDAVNATGTGVFTLTFQK